MDEDKNGYLSPTEFVDFTLANIWQNITIPPNMNVTSALLYSVARQDTAEVFIDLFTEAMKSTDFITDGEKNNIHFLIFSFSTKNEMYQAKNGTILIRYLLI